MPISEVCLRKSQILTPIAAGENQKTVSFFNLWTHYLGNNFLDERQREKIEYHSILLTNYDL